MPFQRIDHSAHYQTVKSRLGESLVRLYRDLEKARHDEGSTEDSFRKWQSQWSKRRDQIARRLELIESQLVKLGVESGTSPRLAVVGVPADSPAMSSMWRG